MKPANLLRIDSLTEDWCDKDMVMLHACFQLLVDCVEKENLLRTGSSPQSITEREITEINAKELGMPLQEIQRLYEWWLIRRNRNDQSELEENSYYEDNEMLKRLIDIRMYLWT